MRHMIFSADYNPFKHRRIISFYCLTHKNEFVLQNKPTTYAQEVDKAVHPLQGYVCWVQSLQMGLSLFLLNAQIENTSE